MNLRPFAWTVVTKCFFLMLLFFKAMAARVACIGQVVKERVGIMVKPIIKGKVVSVTSEPSTFKNRTTQVQESYIKHSVDLICSEPSKGVATVKVYSDRDSLSVKEGLEYVVELSSFSIEKGTPVFVAYEAGFKPAKG